MKLDERFALSEPVLQGDVGTLWRAEDKTSRSTVAVALLDDEAEREGFLAAAVALAGKRNAQKRATEHGSDDDGRPYYVIAPPEGAPLAERFARPPALVVDTLVRVMTEVMEELEEMHGVGLPHGHLDPWTIWCWERGTQIYGRILGFGLFRHDAGQRGARSMAYTAPELVRDPTKDADRGTDVWSLGMVMHEALTASHPFARASVEATRTAVLATRMPLLAKVAGDLPSGLVAAVDRAAAADPFARWEDASSLRKAIVTSMVSAGALGKTALRTFAPGGAAAAAPASVRADATDPQLALASGSGRPLPRPQPLPRSAPPPVASAPRPEPEPEQPTDPELTAPALAPPAALTAAPLDAVQTRVVVSQTSIEPTKVGVPLPPEGPTDPGLPPDEEDDEDDEPETVMRREPAVLAELEAELAAAREASDAALGVLPIEVEAKVAKVATPPPPPAPERPSAPDLEGELTSVAVSIAVIDGVGPDADDSLPPPPPAPPPPPPEPMLAPPPMFALPPSDLAGAAPEEPSGRIELSDASIAIASAGLDAPARAPAGKPDWEARRAALRAASAQVHPPSAVTTGRSPAAAPRPEPEPEEGGRAWVWIVLLLLAAAAAGAYWVYTHPELLQ